MAALPLTMVSCGGEDILFEENVAISDNTWTIEDTVRLEFPIEDSTSRLDFFLNFRNTEDYRWSNLHVFVDIETPSGVGYVDTFEFPLADPSGKWYGKHTGSLVDNSMKFIRNGRFKETGEYHIKITHGMTGNELTGVSDVGLKICPSAEEKE